MFRVAKYFSGIKLLQKSLKSSLESLKIIIIFLSIIVLLAATGVYQAEMSDLRGHENTP
jgi:hypothetical protein